MIDTSKESRLSRFCTAFAGPKIRPLAECVPLPKESLTPIETAVPAFLAAQGAILKAMLSKMCHEEILAFFSLPSALAPWMEVLRNPAYNPLMLRADFVLEGGKPWICEINVDSSVGGAEAAQFLTIERLGEKTPSSPYDDLAKLIAKLLHETNTTKVSICDWSAWQGSGYFDLNWLRLALSASLPGVDVFISTEKDGLATIDRDTLVYRVFLADDALSDQDFTSGMFAQSGYVLSDFSGELLGSKLWMALLHAPEYQEYLSIEDRAAVEATVPYTVLVSQNNIDMLIATKDRYFFKTCSGFGGNGVLCGRNELPSVVRARLTEGSQWIAQLALETDPVTVRPMGCLHPIASKAVYGLYRVGGKWSGTLVRSSIAADIVNVAAGSTIGWAFEESI